MLSCRKRRVFLTPTVHNYTLYGLTRNHQYSINKVYEENFNYFTVHANIKIPRTRRLRTKFVSPHLRRPTLLSARHLGNLRDERLVVRVECQGRRLALHRRDSPLRPSLRHLLGAVYMQPPGKRAAPPQAGVLDGGVLHGPPRRPRWLRRSPPRQL